MTQTTVERIERMLGVHYDWFGRVIEAGADTAAERIADEIDGLRAELAEARAEVERLRPAAEAWGALETLRPMFNAPLPVSAEAERNHYAAIEAADQKYQAAAARAREAAKEGK